MSNENPLAEVYAEIQAAATALASRDQVAVKSELQNNIYPLLALLVEGIAAQQNVDEQRFQLMEQAIAEAISGETSIVLPDLANTIKGALAVGELVCQDVINFQAQVSKAFQDLGGEPIALPARLAQLIGAYKQNTIVAVELLDDATIEPADDGDDEEDDDDTGDDEVFDFSDVDPETFSAAVNQDQNEDASEETTTDA